MELTPPRLELCEIAAVTRAVAERAAVLRSRYGLRTLDALICGTAAVTACDLVLGNDLRWQRVREITFRAVDQVVETQVGPAV